MIKKTNIDMYIFTSNINAINNEIITIYKPLNKNNLIINICINFIFNIINICINFIGTNI